MMGLESEPISTARPELIRNVNAIAALLDVIALLLENDNPSQLSIAGSADTAISEVNCAAERLRALATTSDSEAAIQAGVLNAFDLAERSLLDQIAGADHREHHDPLRDTFALRVRETRETLRQAWAQHETPTEDDQDLRVQSTGAVHPVL